MGKPNFAEGAPSRRSHAAAMPAPPRGTGHVVEAYTSADFREGIEAFLGKRKPQWKNE